MKAIDLSLFMIFSVKFYLPATAFGPCFFQASVAFISDDIHVYMNIYMNIEVVGSLWISGSSVDCSIKSFRAQF